MSGGWRVTGTAEAGTRHLEGGRRCEDAFGHWTDENGGLQVLVVADGVGSAKHGGEGARRAVAAVLEACQLRAPLIRRGRLDSEARWTAFMGHLASAVRLELERAAARDPMVPDGPGEPSPTVEALALSEAPPTGLAPEPGPNLTDQQCIGLRDFATTILVVVLTEPWLACMQIGDGVIVARRGAHLEALTRPAKGEYANEAPFVTDDHFLEAIQVTVLRDHGVDAIALMTDGLERLAVHMATGAPHGPFFDGLFAFAADERWSTEERHALLARELRSEKINRLTDDDKTVLVAVKAPRDGSRDEPVGIEGTLQELPMAPVDDSDAAASPPFAFDGSQVSDASTESAAGS